MAKWDRLRPRVFDRALDLAWDVLGPGADVRFFVDEFFRRHRAQLLAIHNAYEAGELSDEAIRDRVEGLVLQADLSQLTFVEPTTINVDDFRRRFTNRIVEGLIDEDDEDPGPQMAR